MTCISDDVVTPEHHARELYRRAGPPKRLIRQVGVKVYEAYHENFELLRAHSLGELFDRVVGGLRIAYGLDRVTLSLFDPQHELRHLSANENLSSEVIEEVRFIDSVSPLAPRLAQFDRPWLGKYDAADHELMISPGFRHGSRDTVWCCG